LTLDFAKGFQGILEYFFWTVSGHWIIRATIPANQLLDQK